MITPQLLLLCFPCNFRKCMLLPLFLAGQSKHDIISEQCSDTDEHYPHCKLTSCVGRHSDSWLFWPTVYTILSACIHRGFWARTESFVLTTHAPCKANANWANSYTLRWEICGGLFVYFSADRVVNFCKKSQNGERNHSDPVTTSNSVEKMHSALSVSVIKYTIVLTPYTEYLICSINYLLVGLQLMIFISGL